MRSGCRDFITGKSVDTMTVFTDPLDIHHIFPRSWCEKQKPPIPPGVYNSIINKTALSKGTNISVGGDAPSVYLMRIERKHGMTTAELDAILRSHLIDPALLRADDFQGFYDARKAALAALAADAQGKPVPLDQIEPGEGYADDEGMTLDEEERVEDAA